MKRTAGILLACFLFSHVPIAAFAAEELKIGYIDTVKIFAEYKETADAEAVYKKEVDEWKKKAKDMEDELAKMQEEIQSQSLMLSQEKLQEKRLAYDQKAKEYRDYMTNIFDPETGLAAKRNKELTQPIVEKINAVISKIAENEGYTIIFDAAQGNIVYAKKSIDLTQKVMDALSSQLTPVGQ